jgi:RHS repeat-associated protein
VIGANSGTATYSSDARGNLSGVTEGPPTVVTSYTYSAENLLRTKAVGGVTQATLTYDPAMRLSQIIGAAGTTKFAYDGLDLTAEYNGSNVLQRRYVHGPGSDEPLVWYEGAGTTDRRFLHADERGSVIAVSNASGTVTNINAYDEYGIPATANLGRFGYTGQTWLSEIGMNYYKARMYSPTLGRFMQTDPIGYGDGVNWYAYVGSDPVNGRDVKGLTGVYCTGSMLRHDSCSEVGGLRCSGECSNFLGRAEREQLEITTGAGGRFVRVRPSGPATTNDEGDIIVNSAFRWVWDTDFSLSGLWDATRGVRCAIAEFGVDVQDAAGTSADLGLDIAAVGAITSGIGAVTAQPEVAVGGAAIFSAGGTIVSGSGLFALGGAILEGVGGNGSNAIARGAIRWVGGRLPLGSARPFVTNPPNRLARGRSSIPACGPN